MTKGKKKIDKSCKILELPDCVLRLLISYLDATSLYQLTRTCQYFRYFIEDPTFWKYIDARGEPISDEKNFYCSNRIHEKTTHLFFRARDKNCGKIPANFFDFINPFKNLKVLALENQRLNGSKISLKAFPTCLEELSLKKTNVKNSLYFFQYSDKSMKKLRVLILDGCRWVTCNFIMSIEKYESLEIVSAVKCLRLHVDMVPYLCVGRLGCKKLKVFDCRFTGIGHELLRCFYPKEMIQSLYFQSLKSAEVDYGEKNFNNSFMRTVTYSDDNTAVNNNIRDESLIEYINAIASDAVTATPDSLLYKDPYPICTCGGKAKKQQPCSPGPQITEDYYLFEPRRQLMRFVCKKHLSDVQKLPTEFKEFFVSNQKQFYTDMDSGVDSDSESSGSDSDSSCCMYGMGRKMVLLTLGNSENNDLSVQQEVLELNRQAESFRTQDPPNDVVEENRNSNTDSTNSSIGPSTSRNIRLSEYLRNIRNRTKRRHSENEGQDAPPDNKRAKTLNDSELNEVSDKIHEAQVNDLVESAADVGNRLNKFLQTSMAELSNRQARPSWQESGPSTSRMANDPETSDENAGNQSQDTKIWVIIPSKNDPAKHNDAPVTITDSRFHRSRPPAQVGGNPDLARENQEGPSYVVLRRNAATEEDPAARQRQNVERLVTLRDREMARFINPLHQINRFSKNKLGLRRLSLRGFKRITDVALNYIQNLNIDLLDLTYTSVTERGIEDFLVHNPNCRIIHPLYCVCKPITSL